MMKFKRTVRVTDLPTLNKDVQTDKQYCTVKVEKKDERGSIKNLTCTFMDVIGVIISEYCEIDDYIITENEAIQLYDDNKNVLDTVQSRVTKLTIYDWTEKHILDYNTFTNQLIVYNKHTEESFEKSFYNPLYYCEKDPAPTITDTEELQRAIDRFGDYS